MLQDEKKLLPTNELIAGVLAQRCYADATFAEQLGDNPREVLQIADSSDISVQTVRNTEDVVHVPLPAYSCMPEIERKLQEELTDEQLQLVAGGEVIVALITITTIVVATTAVAGVALAAVAGGLAAAGYFDDKNAFNKSVGSGDNAI